MNIELYPEHARDCDLVGYANAGQDGRWDVFCSCGHTKLQALKALPLFDGSAPLPYINGYKFRTETMTGTLVEREVVYANCGKLVTTKALMIDWVTMPTGEQKS